MIVVDASVIASALLYPDRRGERARQSLARDVEWCAPEHFMVEVFSVCRGLVLGGKLPPDSAHRAIGRLPKLGIDRVPLDAMLARMWQLRDAVGGYDAPYVALAEARGLTLATGDVRLARAAAPYCRVEVAN